MYTLPNRITDSSMFCTVLTGDEFHRGFVVNVLRHPKCVLTLPGKNASVGRSAAAACYTCEGMLPVKAVSRSDIA